MISGRRLRPSAIAVATLVVALGAVGCTPGDGGATGGASDIGSVGDARTMVETLRELPFDADAVAVARDVVEISGVLVVEDWNEDSTWDADASEVVRITEVQLESLAIEAANGGGMTGAELEELLPVPAGVPPVAFLLAAWALEYDSPGARFSHALLGERDFTRSGELAYPMLVVTLFLADATADVDASDLPRSSGDGASIVPAAFQSTAAIGAVCHAVSNFVHNAVATVAQALKLSTSGIFGFAAKFWNKLVDLTAGLIQGIVDTVTRPVVDAIVTVFSALETARQATTFLMPWRATVEPDPDRTRFGIDGEVVTGTMTVTVRDSRIPIPEFVLQCSDAFGVNLRDAGSAAGSGVTWAIKNEGRADLAAQISGEPVLDVKQVARFEYQTGQESREVATKGAEHAEYSEVRAAIHRNDVERVRQLLVHVVLDGIPAAIRPIVEPLAAPLLNATTSSLAAFADVRAYGAVTIVYHGPPDDEDECGPNDIPPGRYTGEEFGKYGELERIALEIAPDGVVTGEWFTAWEQPFPDTYNSIVGGTVDRPRALLVEWIYNGQPQTIDEFAISVASSPGGSPDAVTLLHGDCTTLTWSVLSEGAFEYFISAERVE